MSLGWAGTRSVKGKSVKEIAAVLRDWSSDYTPAKAKRNARGLWKFVRIPKGDYIVLYHLFKAYVGRVTRPYYWLPRNAPMSKIFDDEDYAPHRLDVEWLFGKKPLKVDFSNLSFKFMNLKANSIAKIKPLEELLEKGEESTKMPI